MLERLLTIAKRNPEGFSVRLPNLDPVTSGIAAAYAETQDSHGRAGLERCIDHALTHGKVVGGWLNEENGRYYFDSVRIFTNFEKAKAFGKANGQIAIYDISQKRVIKI